MFLSCSRHNIVSPRHSPSDKVEKEKIALLPAGKAETKDGMLIKTTNRLFRCTRAVGLFNGKHLEDIAQHKQPLLVLRDVLHQWSGRRWKKKAVGAPASFVVLFVMFLLLVLRLPFLCFSPFFSSFWPPPPHQRQ